MSSLYECIRDANTNLINMIYTICDGEYKGEKLFLSGGRIAWSSPGCVFLKEKFEKISSVKESLVTDFEGHKLFAERLGREKRIICCGGGHVALQTIALARTMDFDITVIEDRKQFCDLAMENGADRCILGKYEESLRDIESDSDTYFLVLTRGHLFDKECLGEILRKPHAYVGMIGSKHKINVVNNALLEEGFTREELDSVYTPIGIEIGAETPEEIAVSIMAEIIQIKNVKARNFGITKTMLKAIIDTESGKGLEKNATGKHALDGVHSDEPRGMLCTITKKTGSAPRGIGSKMLVLPGKKIVGSVGGGRGEASLIFIASQMLENKETNLKEASIDMTCDVASEDSLICGGSIDVIIEPVMPVSNDRDPNEIPTSAKV